MPLTDAILYVHGTGASAYSPITNSPETSTFSSASFTGYISTTTLTVSSVQNGNLAIGQSIQGAAAGTIITAGSGTTWTVSVSQTLGSSGAPVSLTSQIIQGDSLCLAGSQYSNLELDFGSGVGGGPVGFPSYTEKGYTFPPAIVGAGGVELGLHIQVTGYFNLLTSINFEVCTSGTTGALFNASPNPIAARTLTLAQLQVVGAHYYIPISPAAMLEFVRFYALLTGTDPTTGAIIAWIGPKTGGEQ